MIRCLLLLFLLFTCLNAVSQKKRNPTVNIESSLLQKLNTYSKSSLIPVSVSFKTNQEKLSGKHKLKRQSNFAFIYSGWVSKSEVLDLVIHPDVLFISEVHIPKEELNTGAVDYTVNRINKAHQAFPGEKGNSVVVGVKERAFDTTDIDLKGRTISSGEQSPVQTAHASIMATIIAGAGNSSPFALGVAPAAHILSIDFANLFPQNSNFYLGKRVSVQNHSYGTVVENFYGNEAMAYDLSVVSNPTLIHVFSAGNSGTATSSSGPYAGLASTANLTGNFKQSKNSIAVGALDSMGRPMAVASRGPAYDGRVKPELSAYGEDGSSGAAALVSGTTALLQEAFFKQFGQLPTADVVKAALVNSADDVGPVGIDYLTGYGSLNAYKALQAIKGGNFIRGEVKQNETKTFLLTVPPNSKSIKLTLAWIDTAAQPNATKALVNDLDLVLKQLSTGQLYEPWVLNPSSHIDSLVQSAARKRDSLNNVEQITVDAPSAGVYEIQVRGTKLYSNLQRFALSFQLDTTVFTWSYPTAADPLLAGTSQLLRWNATPGSGSLAYTTDGVNWRLIANGIDLATGYYRWNVPDTLSTALLRMTFAGHEFRSDTIVISPHLDLKVGFHCADSFLLFWKNATADKYRVQQLGALYLENYMETRDTSIVIAKNQTVSRYFAVTPLVGGKAGFRGNTIPYDAAGVDCYFASFYLQTQTPSSASFMVELGTLFNVKELSLQKRSRDGYSIINTINPVSSTSLRFADSALINGENRYRFKLTLLNGTVLYSNEEVVYHFADNPVFVYPNPVRRNEPLKIISNEAGRYTVRIINSSGVEVYQQFITSTNFTLTASQFPKGLYFIWVLDKSGRPFVQKLLVQ